ncbi:hypothetical protein [Glycomyces sp. MUSA5-2]|uniref:hypothetical protein n=1 Tax=Glycomyces sp. MUSA5-2 TaxID=2053002 RepID=UPI00300B548F
MKFIAEHALPLGLTLTGVCIAFAIARFLLYPKGSKKLIAHTLIVAFLCLAATFWFVVNRDYIVEHDTTFADLVEEPRTSMPTQTGTEE